jgi:hypothetical protein
MPCGIKVEVAQGIDQLEVVNSTLYCLFHPLRVLLPQDSLSFMNFSHEVHFYIHSNSNYIPRH